MSQVDELSQVDINDENEFPAFGASAWNDNPDTSHWEAKIIDEALRLDVDYYPPDIFVSRFTFNIKPDFRDKTFFEIYEMFKDKIDYNGKLEIDLCRTDSKKKRLFICIPFEAEESDALEKAILAAEGFKFGNYLARSDMPNRLIAKTYKITATETNLDGKPKPISFFKDNLPKFWAHIQFWQINEETKDMDIFFDDPSVLEPIAQEKLFGWKWKYDFKEKDNDVKVYIKGLYPSLIKDTIFKELAHNGFSPKFIDVVKDGTGRAFGFGFLFFATVEEANQCISAEFVYICHKKCYVSKPKNKTSQAKIADQPENKKIIEVVGNIEKVHSFLNKYQ